MKLRCSPACNWVKVCPQRHTTQAIVREEVPRTASDILNRLNEISFNSSLMREMRAIAFVNKLVGSGTLRDDEMKSMLVHAIEAEEFMKDLGIGSKLNADWES